MAAARGEQKTSGRHQRRGKTGHSCIGAQPGGLILLGFRERRRIDTTISKRSSLWAKSVITSNASPRRVVIRGASPLRAAAASASASAGALLSTSVTDSRARRSASQPERADMTEHVEHSRT